jgi:two-component system, OmpR family, heavy metal sensor histidine kinase CusS
MSSNRDLENAEWGMRSAESRPPIPHSSWSLAARLTAWYAGASFLLVFSATAFLYGAILRHLDREDDQFLAEKVQLLRVLLTERAGDSAALRQAIEGDVANRPLGGIGVRVLDEPGRTLLETPGLSGDVPADAFPAAEPLAAGPPRGAEIETASGRTFRVVAVRTPVGDGVRVLQLAFDRTAEEALLANYRRALLLVLGAALVGCAAAGYHIARRGLRPLTEITAAARRVRSTNLRERLRGDGLPAEIAVLAETFNAMLDRLEEAFARLARFSADIAHELRTPVNNLRGEAEVALGQPRTPAEYREVLGSCLEECDRLARLIDSLLFLARAEGAKVRPAAERIDVARELEAVREFYEAAAGEAGVRLVVEAEAGAAELDRTLFQRAVGNLVANALAHTPAGGTVTLRAAAAGGRLRVEVADTGTGIAPEHLPHVFDRFYRADPARTTADGRVGLGLAIVKSIAEMHGGTAEAASTPDQGTTVTLTLPKGNLRPPPAG